METMSDIDFELLCRKARDGKTAEVLEAVDQDRRLAIRTDFISGWTLLFWACLGRNDNPLLAQGLLERGAYVHSWVLMTASQKGHIAVCAVLLDHGAHPDSNDQYCSALSIAACNDNLQLCLLFISRRANLMLALKGGTALDVYGKFAHRRLSLVEIKERRSIIKTALERRSTLQTAFIQGPHPSMCWARRWPMMDLMTGCGFHPLPDKLLLLQMQSIALSSSREIRLLTVLDTPEKRRAYYMGLIFASDGLLRQIVAFL